jgi:crotonobetainyl-CoA:carnitine CoA-transferase CaiB-like acyl-CoA transferase
MALPLAGIKILTAAQLLSGGYCTTLLSELGADVIKIENPAGGDTLRITPKHFAAFNRGYKSIAIDLRTKRGRGICYKLVKKSHVFIEGYRPGVTTRLGIDYETLKGINPRLIYVSISSFGQQGPYRNRPAHDLTYQGIAGMLAGFISEQDGGSNLPPVAIGDFSSGMFAAITILAALIDLKEYGNGQYIDVSMTDGLVSWMSMRLAPNQSLAWKREPNLNIYRTKDGKYITVSIAFEPHFWRNLCRVVNREDLGEISIEERQRRRQELSKILVDAFLSRTREEWLRILTEADVPNGPVYVSADEVFNDPQLRYRGMVGKIENIDGAGNTGIGARLSPMKSFGMLVRGAVNAPRLGENTQEILHSLGYTRNEIEELNKAEILK